jgi:hypothetical protein
MSSGGKSEKHLKDFVQFQPTPATMTKIAGLKINELAAGVCWKRQKLGFESLRLRFSLVDLQGFVKIVFGNPKDLKLFFTKFEADTAKTSQLSER